jgi:CBS domain-containing protein
MSNTISQRIFDFLKAFPPFNLLSSEDLMTVATKCEVKYLELNELVFNYNDALHPYFYIVKDGAVGLYRNEQLVDHCDEGDIFGIRAILRNDAYRLKASAIEESIIYALPAIEFLRIIQDNIDVHKYLATTFASNLAIEGNQSDLIEIEDFNIPTFQKVSYSTPVITCSTVRNVAEAAKLMTVHKVGSIIITNAQNHPLGIITDKDLRSKIATGFFKINEPVSTIMSKPVRTFSAHISALESQMIMLENDISHLCITADGTDKSEVLGMVTAHDMVVINSNNPAVLLKQIKRSKSIEELAGIRLKLQLIIENYVNSYLPIDFISGMVSSINNNITKRLIELTITNMPEQPPTAFTWLALGSQGREEQLLFTDQDNALIFEDVPKEDYQRVKSYFLEMAEQVNKALAIVGFEECPAKMMASNPQWCLSISEWQGQFKSWITQPSEASVMMCTIFFDFKRIYGDEALEFQLSESIQKSVNQFDIFLNYLGLNALQNPPPLSFFRKFIVEDSGAHHDQFDIKARAMMPLVDAARLLVLEKGVNDPKSTIKRFELMATLEPQNEVLYQSCKEAYKTLLTFRTIEGLKYNDSGRFVNLELLSKSNRLQLKQAFKPIKEIQNVIQIRFKLAQIM